MRKKNVNAVPGYVSILLNIFFILIVIACVVPVIIIFSISITKEDSILKYGYNVIPRVISTVAYSFIAKSSSDLARAYMVTIFVTVVGAVSCTILTALYAYPLSRKEFKYKKFFTYFIFFTMLFTGGLVPWYIVCIKVVKIQDSYAALILPYLMNAFNVIVMRTFFKLTIPNEIIEAARIDGAGELKTFFSIVLPLSLPALATIGLFATLLYWNDYFLPLMLISKSSLYNLQYLMYKLLMNVQMLSTIASPEARKEYLELPAQSVRMAYAIISVGPIVIAYPFFQKYFVSGLTIGAVKG
jgi:putative aldouronate transport system permease protein